MIFPGMGKGRRGTQAALNRVRGGRTARQFRKSCTALRGHPEITEIMNNASLSQGLLCRGQYYKMFTSVAIVLEFENNVNHLYTSLIK